MNWFICWNLSGGVGSLRPLSIMTGTVRCSQLLLMLCLIGTVLSQTFQYSRGWTNGRKRSGPSIFQEGTVENSDVLGVCQMLRLKDILSGKRSREQISLPCEVIGRPEDEIVERFRRRALDSEPPTFDSATPHGS